MLFRASVAAVVYFLVLYVPSAWAITTYQEVTVTVQGGSSAPAPAAAAGFTTLAMNMDFTTSAAVSGFDGSPKFNAQDLSTWSDCNGNSANPPPWHNIGECGLNFGTDGGIGVLDTVWPESALGTHNSVSMQTCISASGACSFTVPVGHYEEFRFRVTQASTTRYDSGVQQFMTDYWSWPTTQNGAGGESEWDFLEAPAQGFATYAAIRTAGGGGLGGNWFYGASTLTTYHTFGLLFTDNGSGTLSLCKYMDGSPTDNPCPTTSITDPTEHMRMYLNFNVGPYNDPTPDPHGDIETFTQYWRIWSCSSWRTGNCFTGVITNPP